MYGSVGLRLTQSNGYALRVSLPLKGRLGRVVEPAGKEFYSVQATPLPGVVLV